MGLPREEFMEGAEEIYEILELELEPKKKEESEEEFVDPGEEEGKRKGTKGRK